VFVRDFFIVLVLLQERYRGRCCMPKFRFQVSTILVLAFLVNQQQTHVPALATQLYGRTEKSSLFRGQACTRWSCCLIVLLSGIQGTHVSSTAWFS
jgi:hypothetical protein